MSDVTVSPSHPLQRPKTRPHSRFRDLLALDAVVVTSIVLLGAAPRVFVAFLSPTATYFPDEYIYSRLARSISHGSLTIRGVPAHFPALLEPLLAAPLWRVG